MDFYINPLKEKFPKEDRVGCWFYIYYHNSKEFTVKYQVLDLQIKANRVKKVKNNMTMGYVCKTRVSAIISLSDYFKENNIKTFK